ncbi:MAG: hypothetical protein AUI58_00545 [Chloroflexi bacterium 13_1_40CM_2_70_6]|nr:MAG: hypothetical protein AUI58_00545 [Chloroflexi bacterium 13_1_40CM_2_70_6]
MSDLRRARFARLVRNALDELPAEFRERMRNIAIVVEDDATEEQTRGRGELLGLYEGVPLTARGSIEPYIPDRIFIFRRPIERMTASQIAHHFGISDDRLEELGLGDAE